MISFPSVDTDCSSDTNGPERSHVRKGHQNERQISSKLRIFELLSQFGLEPSQKHAKYHIISEPYSIFSPSAVSDSDTKDSGRMC